MQALIQANIKNTAGLRYTGIGLGSCARLEMILPLGAGNLHKGERWALYAQSICTFGLIY